MRKIFTLVALILATATLKASPQKDKVALDRLSSVIAECSDMPGFDVVSVGRIGTSALKSVIRLGSWSEKGGEDARKVMNIIKDIKKIAVVDYDDCCDADKARFTRKIERLLKDDCLVMEARDGGDVMKIYGVLDEKTDRIDNFVMYAPADCSLICLFGSIPLSTVTKAISQ